ncbi:MAG: M4 family metallopeptidase [Flavobacteriales bacterium]|nr:M4 family metallopeptidase [Flavobacteriales bacterium]
MNILHKMFKIIRINVFCLALALVFYSVSSIGQNVAVDNNAVNEELLEICKDESSPRWLLFKDQIDSEGLFVKNKEAFRLGDFDEMVLIRTQTNLVGNTTERYQQFYKGIRVNLGNYVLHYDGDKSLTLANGEIISGLDLNSVPQITSSKASDICIEYLVAEQEKNNLWFDADSIEILKNELVISKIGVESTKKSDFRLLYSVTMIVKSFVNEMYSFAVDANTGEVLEMVSPHLNGLGKVTTLYNGKQEFVSTWTGTISRWKLYDETRGEGISTQVRWGADKYISDNDNDWDTGTDKKQKRAHASAHWAAQEIWDWWKVGLGRYGIDGNGSGLIIRADFKYTTGAFAVPSTNPLQITLSVKVNGQHNELSALDIIGHEMMHGVLYYTSGFDPSAPGYKSHPEMEELNEGLCDIFGEMAQYNVTGSNNWIYGSEPRFRNKDKRCFSYPIINGKDALSFEDERYLAAYSSLPDEEDDEIGPHNRAGVVRHFFYLLAMGGEYGGETIEGIGREKAIQITYLMITDYLNFGDGYSDAKNGCIFAAMELYGGCSDEVIQTIKAWDAVNVSSIGGIDDFLSIKSNHCNLFVSGPLTRITERAIKEIEFNCAVPSSGKSIHLIAGDRIEFSDGFTSGDDFEAEVLSCLANSKSLELLPVMPNTAGELNKSALKSGEVENGLNVLVFPNPANNNLNLVVQGHFETGLSKVEIYNSLGETVFFKERLHSSNEIDVSGFPSGVYIVRVLIDSNQIIQKIVKN